MSISNTKLGECYSYDIDAIKGTLGIFVYLKMHPRYNRQAINPISEIASDGSGETDFILGWTLDESIESGKFKVDLVISGLEIRG